MYEVIIDAYRKAANKIGVMVYNPTPVESPASRNVGGYVSGVDSFYNPERSSIDTVQKVLNDGHSKSF